MAHRLIRLIYSFVLVLLSIFVSSGQALAMADPFDEVELPSLNAFVEQVSNDQPGELRGIYIPGILAALVVQQPAGMGDFVSPWQNIVTQFRLASEFGSTGLLAHNYLAGETFALLQQGQEIHLIQGDGRVSTFVVTDSLRYRVMEQESASATYVNMEDHTSLTHSGLFTKVYNRPGQVIFQTCIQAGNDLTWGRLFVIAEPFRQ